MSAARVECPECQAQLKVASTAAGKKIRCPKCQKPFTVPTEEEDEAPPARPPASRPQQSARKRAGPPREAEEDEEEPIRGKPSRSREEADDEEEPRQRRKGRPSGRRKKQGSPILLWVGIGGGAVLLLAVVTGVILFLNRKPDSPGQGPNPLRSLGLGSEPKAKSLIVGKWKAKDAGPTEVATLEFTSDGKVTKTVIWAATGKIVSELKGTYTVTSETTLESDVKNAGYIDHLKNEIKVTQNELTLGQPGGPMQVWIRVP